MFDFIYDSNSATHSIFHPSFNVYVFIILYAQFTTMRMRTANRIAYIVLAGIVGNAAVRVRSLNHR